MALHYIQVKKLSGKTFELFPTPTRQDLQRWVYGLTQETTDIVTQKTGCTLKLEIKSNAPIERIIKSVQRFFDSELKQHGECKVAEAPAT